ncbi:hypothetical protein ACFQS7_29355 [Dankookia sp. GCM10030260]|uniref:hypothetical protein n=1 Tax=Dankookia sp. GCM10030260 TaxID=3273390 RepID=UPI003617DD3F
MRDGGLFLILFLGGVFIGCLLRRIGLGILILTALFGGVIYAVLLTTPLIRGRLVTPSLPTSASVMPSVPKERPGWAEVGRAMSAYGARHREVHALLRARGGEAERTVPPSRP